MNIEVSASILSADFGKLAEAVQLCERSGVSRIHVDVMDGHFVPNITIGPIVTQAVRKYTRLPVAAHLMIENPWDYIDMFADAGADIIAVHAECYGERRPACREYGQYPKEVDAIDPGRLLADIRRIRAKGRQACLVLNPGTPVACLGPVLGELESILVMAVNPGFSGQRFQPSALAKIEWLRAQGFRGDIAVDGGVNAQTAPDIVRAGANVLVTASYFFFSKDPVAAVKGLKALSHDTGKRAQAIMEYLLVLVVVVGVVFSAFKFSSSGLLVQTQQSADAYFDVGTAAIMGGYYNVTTGRFVRTEPAPVNGGWCAWSECIRRSGKPRVRVRECACPRPAFGGSPCSGAASQTCS